MTNFIDNVNNQMDGILEALKPVQSVEGLGAKETELANKQIEQDSKGIDWAEFDKLDQIIMSSND